MKIAALILCACALSGCFEATFPIGEGGRYGTAYVGYRPPAVPLVLAPLYRDK